MLGKCKSCSSEYKYFDSQHSGTFCSRECTQDYRVKTLMESGKATKGTALTYLKRFIEYKCNDCGIDEHNHKPIVLQVDHIDGNNKNNRVENIRWLCPNCHSQTSTFGSKNVSEDGHRGRLKGLAYGWNREDKSTGTIAQLEALPKFCPYSSDGRATHL